MPFLPRMNKPIEPTFDEDWKKAVLFVLLVEQGLPPWAAGPEGWKALAALTDWPKEKCLRALAEACRRGMIKTVDTNEEAFPA